LPQAQARGGEVEGLSVLTSLAVRAARSANGLKFKLDRERRLAAA